MCKSVTLATVNAVETEHASFFDKASYDRLGHNRAALLASFNAPTCLARRHFVDLNGGAVRTTCDSQTGPELISLTALWLRCLTKLVCKLRLTTRETLGDDVGSDRRYVWYEKEFLLNILTGCPLDFSPRSHMFPRPMTCPPWILAHGTQVNP